MAAYATQGFIEPPCGLRSIPANRLFVEVDVDLLRFEILLNSPRSKFAAHAGLLVSAPRSFHAGGLHMVYPDDACAQRFDNAKCLVNVARPHGCGQSIMRVVGDANGFGFTLEGNDRGDRTEDLFACDACVVVDVIEDRRLDVVPLFKLRGTPAPDGDLGFLTPNFKIGADALVLLLADDRTHFRLAIERRAQSDGLRLCRHCLDKFRIDFLLDENPTACRAHLALIDEDTEERAVYGGLPIGVCEKDVGRLAA